MIYKFHCQSFDPSTERIQCYNDAFAHVSIQPVRCRNGIRYGDTGRRSVCLGSWWEHHFYQPCLRADGLAQTGELASAVVEVMVRDMRSRPSHIPTSYHFSACLAARSEIEKKTVFVLICKYKE
ncbi:hypothetical protein AVEN_12490-1 [Araneus ventricosus]|uniref:Uncharacterized protein n=1 Tax=Araneus ventricosus TaxID=182803 RepID=A0A4Y2GYD5_ARAVE|nr:hypothetical protein AVEN_12490-1 [Araneus ventricosus]